MNKLNIKNIQKKLKINNKYEDINAIFDYTKICDEYILVRRKEENRIYIFEVVPIAIVDLKVEQKTYIFNLYKEFLRQIDYDFQIIIRRKKFDIKKYFKFLNENIKSLGEVSIDFYAEYLDQMDKLFNSENIYCTKIFFALKIKGAQANGFNKNSMINMFTKLEEIGCKVRAINDEHQIMKVMYEFMNKEEVME